MYRRMMLVLFILVLLVSACDDSGGSSKSSATKDQQQVTADLAEEVRSETLSGGAVPVEAMILAERIRRTNDIAHVQYLYVISPFSGDIIFQATVVGKISSTTKRLDVPQEYKMRRYNGNAYAEEYDRIGPDGTYGSSTPGIVWFDTSGQMIEMKIGGGEILIVLERPYVFDGTINLQHDIRIQGSLDQDLDAQRERIEVYLATGAWSPGDEVPLDILIGEVENE